MPKAVIIVLVFIIGGQFLFRSERINLLKNGLPAFRSNAATAPPLHNQRFLQHNHFNRGYTSNFTAPNKHSNLTFKNGLGQQQNYKSSNLTSQANITISHQRGFYLQAIEVNLSCNNCNNGETILFTLNNATPTSNNASTYIEPISISKTTTLKATIFSGETYSQVVAHTYIFLEDIIASEYIAQTIVTNNSTQITAAFTSLPAISISTNNAIPNAIIQKDVATSIEIFNASDFKSTAFNCGLETWGGSQFNLKKHYRLEFKEQYGADELKLNLFKPINPKIEPVNHFNRLLLRSASQDGLNSEYADEAQAQFIRNRVLMDLQLQMAYPAPHGRFVQVFFNQQYIGVYHLMERPDVDFFKDYYFKKVPKDSIELRKNSSYLQVPYRINLFDEMEEAAKSDLSEANNYQQLNEVLDVEQATAYLLLNHYSGNFDYDKNRNNLGAGTQNNPYKFILWDVDLTLDNEGVFKEIYGEQLAFNGLNLTGPVPATLLQNEAFKLKLADALYCHCFNQGVLTKENVKQVYTKRANEIKPALITEAARWGAVDFEFNSPTGHFQVDNWQVISQWENEYENTLNHFIENRTDTLIKQYKQVGIFPELLTVAWANETEMWNEPIALINKNKVGEIYYTTDGSDPRAHEGAVANAAYKYENPFKVTNGDIVTARVKFENNWSATCPKKIYIPQQYANVVINEIHYTPIDSVTLNLDTISGKKFEFIELYNKGNLAVDLTDVELKAGVNYKFKKGTTIEAYTYKVLAADSAFFMERYGFAAVGEFKGNLSNEGETILLIAPFYKTIDSLTYQVEFPWPEMLGFDGASLSLADTSLDNESVTNWQASWQKHGTPGKVNFDDTIGVGVQAIFNEMELNYLPNGDWWITAFKGEQLERIDIYNAMGALVHQQFSSNKIENSYLPKGIYLVKVQTKAGKLVKKMMKF